MERGGPSHTRPNMIVIEKSLCQIGEDCGKV